ncbi:uncharacterized protein K444DRAFT_306263 [Hyaloscypha bicolor E]|uniref:Uncharacterized protein n=1 Tax=Hyaloscypha bicolor E TaxID=1095630 RepID=A0A2J6TMA5_9HELO|nr:uncharacterized protein K444DRAFT_306263 [Hyaloscypha bicolor E]PMD64165.1 hypothetical protein K444DRAFT_306263 [Hyaloscypha bicolor E]
MNTMTISSMHFFGHAALLKTMIFTGVADNILRDPWNPLVLPPATLSVPHISVQWTSLGHPTDLAPLTLFNIHNDNSTPNFVTDNPYHKLSHSSRCADQRTSSTCDNRHIKSGFQLHFPRCPNDNLRHSQHEDPWLG